MKKMTMLLLAVFSAVFLRAQDFFPGADPQPYPPFADSWKADPMMVTGNYRMYRMDTPAPTPAPAGFKPFYISTYGRHGARFFGRNDLYDTLARLFDAGAQNDALTADGQEFYRRFQAVYALARGRGGDLTQLGVVQQQELARKMLRDYPAVFRGRKVVDARSTTVPRCILSMTAFCDALGTAAPSLEIRQDASAADMYYLKPNSKYNPKVRPDEVDSKMDVGEGRWLEPWREMWRQTAHPQEFFARLFKDPSFVEAFGNPVHLERECFYLMADTPCVSAEIDFRAFFDSDEAARLWELENWRFYQVSGPGRTYQDRNWAYAEVLLDQIVRSAGEDMADGRTAARLRFGHDYMLVNLLTLLNLDGWNVATEDFDRIKEVFRFSELPMATNLKLIFYRNRAGEVLVRAALNDREVRLHIDGAEGPYYRWEDFEAFCRRRIMLARQILER